MRNLEACEMFLAKIVYRDILFKTGNPHILLLTDKPQDISRKYLPSGLTGEPHQSEYRKINSRLKIILFFPSLLLTLNIILLLLDLKALFKAEQYRYPCFTEVETKTEMIAHGHMQKVSL